MARRSPRSHYRILVGDSTNDRIQEHQKTSFNDMANVIGDKANKPEGTQILKASSTRRRVNAMEDDYVMIVPNQNITVIPPKNPSLGSYFGICGFTNADTAFNIDPGGVQIEDPHAMGTFHSASFQVSGSGFRKTWHWMGSSPSRWWIT